MQIRKGIIKYITTETIDLFEYNLLYNKAFKILDDLTAIQPALDILNELKVAMIELPADIDNMHPKQQLITKIVYAFQKASKIPVSDQIVSRILFESHQEDTSESYGPERRLSALKDERSENFFFTTLFEFVYYSEILTTQLVKDRSGLKISDKQLEMFKEMVEEFVLEYIRERGFNIQNNEGKFPTSPNEDLLDLAWDVMRAYAENDPNHDVVPMFNIDPQILEGLRYNQIPSEPTLLRLADNIERLRPSDAKIISLEKIEIYMNEHDDTARRAQTIGLHSHFIIEDLIIRYLRSKGIDAFYEIKVNKPFSESTADQVIARNNDFIRNIEAHQTVLNIPTDTGIVKITLDYTTLSDENYVAQKLSKNYQGPDRFLIVVLYGQKSQRTIDNIKRKFDVKRQQLQIDNAKIITAAQFKEFIGLDGTYLQQFEDLENLVNSAYGRGPASDAALNQLRIWRQQALRSMRNLRASQTYYENYYLGPP